MMKALRFLFGWCVLVSVVLGSVRLQAFDRSFYEAYYEKTRLASQIGVSEADLTKSMQVMLDFVQGKRADLNERIVREGRTVPVYNAKEKAHMVDVRLLYERAMIVLGAAVAGMVLTLFGMAWIAKDPKRLLANACAGLLTASLCFGIVLVWLGLWIATDFTDFWTRFHTLFFTNDLWLLDPATDFMIVICPESMFSALVVAILLRTAFILLPLELGAWWLLKKKLPIGLDAG
ncbi:TIGR01906 family membrane protein [Dubosiella muris]|uniref:TIGR01906 family membrane protein n=1 Tax=Dubosiella muris TaxID=3038133 RepID=A0AC61R8Y2_9FIRM|nr:TIGR01906 family membrane protein [Dubosiella muris]TGY66692.1 TIGR01906 family membrane protein [Dubosiella muris]